MSDPWFFCAAIPEVPPHAGEPVVVDLDPGEAQHAVGARRLRVGDRVALFDGAGVRATAELTDASRSALRGRILERWAEPPLTPRLHLASALPKGDRQATLLGMAGQLGMASFTPLACRHSVSQPGRNAETRWTRILREACKQSRRAHVPELRPVASPEQVAEVACANGACFVLDPNADPLAEAALPGQLEAAQIWLLVGPEAGFDSGELAALEACGARGVRLGLDVDAGAGSGILRTETAAVAALSVFAFASANAARSRRT